MCVVLKRTLSIGRVTNSADERQRATYSRVFSQKSLPCHARLLRFLRLPCPMILELKQFKEGVESRFWKRLWKRLRQIQPNIGGNLFL